MILHIFTGGREFVGRVDDGTDKRDKVLLLKDAVGVQFRHEISGDITRLMHSLKKDNDYIDGDIVIHAGAGVIVLQLNEMGEMVKQYIQTTSGIHIAQKNELDKIKKQVKF